MVTYKIIALILLICFWVIGAVPVSAELADVGTYWLMVDATSDSDARSLFRSFGKILTEKGKVLQKNVHYIVGDEATEDELQTYLSEMANASRKIETFIFLYHGVVLRPKNANAMFFSMQLEETIQDTTLNKWLKSTGANRIIVILDGYAEEDNLAIYYGNREVFGTAALNLIQPPDTAGKKTFLKTLIDALSEDKIDTDDNRNITVLEIYQQLQTNRAFEQSIFAPTGNVDQTVMKLSPAVEVTSFPEGAQIFINEKEFGVTPQLLTENLQQGSYNVSVRKAGYSIPSTKSAELTLTQGEILSFTWELKPISVLGSVTAPSDISVVGTHVSIHGTEYGTSVGEDGTYTFQDWNSSHRLTPGQEYTLYAKQGDLYHGSATFTFDGYAAIEKPIKMEKKTWFEIAELEFRRHDHQKAVTAFQNAVENRSFLGQDFPSMSEDLIVLLFTTFADAVDKEQFQDVKYMVATAKLAEAYGQPELVKKYWKLVQLNAQKGSPTAKLAKQRLWQLNPWRNIFNIGIVCLFVLIIASGIWTFYRYQKSKRKETELDA